MSDPDADSALDAGEATGTAPSSDGAADSTPTPSEGGQEQGDQSKRVNDLMSLANRRLSERDQALAEVEQLRAQLDEQVLAEQQALDGMTQVEAMFPERFAPPEPEPQEQREVRSVIDPNNAPRPSLQAQRAAAVPYSPSMTPGARYAREQAEINVMKSQLNQLGRAWEQGLND